MNILLSEYINTLNSVCQTNGFIRIGKCYVRIDHSILKTFRLFLFADGDRFDVRFGVAPLCQPDLKEDYGENSLSSFDVENMVWYSKREIQQCDPSLLQQVFRKVETTIIPMLNRCKDEASSLHEIEQFCNIVYANWEQRLKKPVTRRVDYFLFQPEVYFFAIRSQNRELLEKIICAQIKEYHMQLDRIKIKLREEEEKDNLLILQERLIHYIEKKSSHLQAVKADNWQMFEYDLAVNEKKNLQYFTKKRVIVG